MRGLHGLFGQREVHSSKKTDKTPRENMVKRLNASKCFRTFSDLAAKRGAASYDFEKSF